MNEITEFLDSLTVGSRINPAPERPGDWMETFTGKKFYVLDPRPEDICIKDIAHSLSLQCRYNGHCKRFYSVAEHCVLISESEIVVSRELELEGLLHDAAEAYLSDIPRPVKASGYRLCHEIEKKIEEVIAKKFGLRRPFSEWVDEVDFRILANERAALMSDSGNKWDSNDPLLDIEIHCWMPGEAERQFLVRFHELQELRQAGRARHDEFCDQVRSSVNNHEMLKALEIARQFIKNGTEFGYIQLPEPPDPACFALQKIESAIANAARNDKTRLAPFNGTGK